MIYWTYLKYLARHKWHVFVASCDLGVPLLGILHDLSKFRPSEFIPYATYFYGPHAAMRTQTDAEKDAFDAAWLVHQHANKHHWQHWVLREDSGATKVLPMPDRYRREMLADWRGAGMAITGQDNTAAWFKKNRTHMILHPETAAWLYEQMGIVRPWWDDIRVPRPDGVQFRMSEGAVA